MASPVSGVPKHSLIREKPPKQKNWIKTAAIIVIIVGVLIAAAGGLCWYGIFPSALLGSQGIGITIALGAGIALPFAYLLYKHWSPPKNPD